MGKENSTVSSKNNRETNKAFHRTEKKPRAKKSNASNKKESVNDYEVDSLEFMRDVTKSKNLNGIDEKIKLLKTELKSLLCDKKIDKDYEHSPVVSRNNNLLKYQGFNHSNPVIVESNSIEVKDNNKGSIHSQVKRENFDPVYNSTPLKLSEHLEDKNIVKKEEKLSDTENLSPQSKSPPVASTASSGISNTFLIPQEKVEFLLYRSFIIQRFGSDLPLPEANDSKNKKPAKQSKKKKFQRPKKKTKDNNKKLHQQTLTKSFGKIQRGKKRRRISLNSSESDVEVLNIESSSTDVESDNETVCLDSDIEGYDWNEPFVINESEPSLEKDIAEICENNANTDIMEADLSCFKDENEKTVLKEGWECPVCFEKSKGQEVVATQCGHVFCKKCLDNHFSKLNKSCPSCRANLENKPYITLFNF